MDVYKRAVGRTGGRHAVILGASLAGLTAARVLSEHFDRVTLVERDRLEDSVAPRKGVPQGRHLHALLKKGEELLSELFPGIRASLLAQGAVPVEFGTDFVWHHFGAWKARVASEVVAICLSRPLLDAEVRRRVLSIRNVALIDECSVRGYTFDASRRRITGIELQRREGSSPVEVMEADLVIDACGRGSSTPKWLEALGLGRPEESTVKVDVGYTTRIFKKPATGAHGWKAMYVLGQAPESGRLGALLPIEGDRWIVVAGGLVGDHAPADADGWMDYLRGLPSPALYEAVKDAEPIGEPEVFKFPAHLRRHYEQMKSFPDGLAVMGDSVCSFNPIYGQGMTCSVLEAIALGECLAEQRRRSGDDLTGLSRRFQKRVGKIVSVPWMMSTSEDFRHPGVEGRRPFGYGLIKWYTGRMHQVASSDPDITRRFFRIMHMLDSPAEMGRPGVLFKVLRGPRPVRALAAPVVTPVLEMAAPVVAPVLEMAGKGSR